MNLCENQQISLSEAKTKSYFFSIWQEFIILKDCHRQASAEELSVAIAELKIRKSTFEDAEKKEAMSGPPKVRHLSSLLF